MIFAIKVLFGPQFPTAVAGWVRGMHVLEVIIDALPRPTDTDHRHPLRVISELSPSDIALVVKGCAEGLERVLNVRPSPHIPPCSRPLLQILSRPSFLEGPRPYGLKPGYPAPVILARAFSRSRVRTASSLDTPLQSLFRVTVSASRARPRPQPLHARPRPCRARALGASRRAWRTCRRASAPTTRTQPIRGMSGRRRRASALRAASRMAHPRPSAPSNPATPSPSPVPPPSVAPSRRRLSRGRRPSCSTASTPRAVKRPREPAP